MTDPVSGPQPRAGRRRQARRHRRVHHASLDARAHRLRLAGVVLALAGLVACSSTPPVLGGPSTATIGPAGGTLQATGEDGVRYRIVFPAGAFEAPTSITLRPLAAASSSVARFRVEPAGLVLGAEATLTATLPAGTTVAPATTFAFGFDTEPTYVPTTVQGSSLEASLRYFGVPTDAWGASASGGSAVLAPQQSGEDTVAAAQANCSQRLSAMQDSFDALMATNSFEAAIRVALNAASLAMQCADDEQTTTWLEQVPTAACSRYDDLVLLAQVTAADTYARFTELAQPIMNWWSTLQKLDVACPSATPPTQVIGEKLSQFLTFYSGKVQGLAFTADYDQLLDEARKVWGLRGQATLLDLPDVENQLEQQVLYPIMDQLRDRSFDECVDADDHYYLFTMLQEPFTSKRVPIGSVTPLSSVLELQNGHAGFQDSEVQTDIQYCASDLTLEVWSDPDVPEELTDKRRELGPGSEPGQQTSTATTEGPVEGHLVLRGAIERLLCGDERSIVEHELVVTFHGTEVHRASTLDANPEIDVENALVSAGLSPTGLNEVDVVVRRESDACQSRYGSQDYPLFTVTYTADPAPSATSASATPTSLVAEQDTPFTFQIPWTDAGENLVKLHMRYDLGGAVQTEEIDLAGSGAVSGFDGAGGTGTYQQTLWVGCSENGTSPIVVTMTLVDEYGQVSDERQTSVNVTYGTCPNATAAGQDGPVFAHGLRLGGTSGGAR